MRGPEGQGKCAQAWLETEERESSVFLTEKSRSALQGRFMEDLQATAWSIRERVSTLSP